MNDRENLLLEIKHICDTLSKSIEKDLDAESTGEITITIKLLQSKLSLYLIDLP